MDGGASSPDEEWTAAQGWVLAELLGVFGPVSGAGLDDELAELVDGPPWRPVRAADVDGLLVAYRQATGQADELRAALLEAGLRAAEFPQLCGGLNGQGRAVVRLGEVSVATGERLAQLLRARPHPPAARGKAA